MTWLQPYWAALRAGKKIEFRFLHHPAIFGFKQFALAENVGQLENWALPLGDGSRLHLWLMPDGRWIMHRDATNPALGLGHAIVHVMTETRIGPVLMLGGIVGALALVANRA